MTNSARLFCSSDEPLRAIHSHGTQLRAGRELDALAKMMFGVKEICKITSSSDIPDIPNNPTTTDPPLRTLYQLISLVLLEAPTCHNDEAKSGYAADSPHASRASTRPHKGCG